MSADAALDREAAVFVRYLTGADPSSPGQGGAAGDYVLAKYRDAHARGAVGEATDGFDAALVRWAAAGPLRARWVDGYARFFASGGLLRRKLVLVLALLESRAPTDALVDQVEPGSRAGFLAGMTLSMGLFALRLVGAALVLTPARLVLSGRRAA